MTDFIFNSLTTTGSTITTSTLLISLGVAFALGIFISFSYTKTQKDCIPSKSFALTLAILPAVITVIIMLIGSNIASAFSLSGAFAIIRFRSAPGSPKDITYVLFSMAVGLACGLGYVGYAVVTAVLLCAVIFVLELLQFGNSKVTAELLKITIPEDLDYKHAFEGVLKRHTESYKLLKVKTTNLGSLYELQYSVITKEAANEKEFIDELRCRNGNLNITLVLAPESAEF